jgi:hypothetical protein
MSFLLHNKNDPVSDTSLDRHILRQRPVVSLSATGIYYSGPYGGYLPLYYSQVDLNNSSMKTPTGSTGPYSSVVVGSDGLYRVTLNVSATGASTNPTDLMSLTGRLGVSNGTATSNFTLGTLFAVPTGVAANLSSSRVLELYANNTLSVSVLATGTTQSTVSLGSANTSLSVEQLQ